jgi:hypothetical protein
MLNISSRVAMLLSRKPLSAAQAAVQARAFTTTMPDDISRHNVGILAMDAFIPNEFVAQDSLEGAFDYWLQAEYCLPHFLSACFMMRQGTPIVYSVFNGVSAGKYTKGLGQVRSSSAEIHLCAVLLIFVTVCDEHTDTPAPERFLCRTRWHLCVTTRTRTVFA